MSRSRLLAVVLVLAWAGGGATGAAASQQKEAERSYTIDEVARLARQAQTDKSALARLRQVKVVNGRDRNIDEAFAGASESETRARLRQLAQLSSAPQGQARSDTSPRDAARQAVEQRAEPPEPQRRQSSWLAGILQAIADFLAALLTSPITLAIVVIALGFLMYRAVQGKRFQRKGKADKVEKPEDNAPSGATLHARALPHADELDEAARRAEAAGDLDLAVRLIFQAGLSRLVAAGRLAPSETTPNAAVRRTLRSQPFDFAADGFERIVYGQRPAVADDVTHARAAWAEVLR